MFCNSKTDKKNSSAGAKNAGRIEYKLMSFVKEYGLYLSMFLSLIAILISAQK